MDTKELEVSEDFSRLVYEVVNSVLDTTDYFTQSEIEEGTNYVDKITPTNFLSNANTMENIFNPINNTTVYQKWSTVDSNAVNKQEQQQQQQQQLLNFGNVSSSSVGYHFQQLQQQHQEVGGASAFVSTISSQIIETQQSKMNCHNINSASTNFQISNRSVGGKYCSFCKKNGELPIIYTNHFLYENGRLTCPILKDSVCTLCGRNGHTLSHCRYNNARTLLLKMIELCNLMKSNGNNN